MWQMVFANVSVQGWIIGPYVQGFFYGPQEVWSSLPSMVKIVNSDIMTRDVMMVIYGRWGLEMFFQPLFKIPSSLTNILIITINPVTLIPVNDPTFFVYWVFVLWGHEVVLDGLATFQVYINPILLENVFVALTEPLMVWDHNLGLRTTGCAGPRLVNVASSLLLMGRQASQFNSVNGPVRIFAVLQGLMKVIFFLLQCTRC